MKAGLLLSSDIFKLLKARQAVKHVQNTYKIDKDKSHKSHAKCFEGSKEGDNTSS